MKDWYDIDNAAQLDTPALLVYPERIKQNIRKALSIAGSPNRLRPHVKTSKIAEVCRMMIDEGIRRFKCATISEAEMLAQIGADDVLLAYQPVGPKVERFYKLSQTYTDTKFSCLVDHRQAAGRLSQVFTGHSAVAYVYIDINNGMNRTGIRPQDAMDLFQFIQEMPGLFFAGLHVYDGHIKDREPGIRESTSEEAFREVSVLREQLELIRQEKMEVIAGGSTTFPFHARRGMVCSPGTFVFWDQGYRKILPEQPFDFAAVIMTRVVSIPDGKTITCDLGYKSVAAETSMPRVHFLNAPDAVQAGHSEEHMTVGVADSSLFNPGDILYAVPEHICPSVALYDRVMVVRDGSVSDSWDVVARDRSIGV